MRSKTMTIMAAAVLFIPTIAYAQPSSSSSSNAAPSSVVKVNAPGEVGWTFAVLTFRQYPSLLTVKREPYGVFTSRDDCDEARAKKIDELDRGDYRQPHWLKDAPVISSTIAVGAKSITTVQPGGPTQTMNVTDCEVEKFSADSQMAQKN
jgi:hypothetical protein